MRLGFGYAFPIAGGDAAVYNSFLQPISGTESSDGVTSTYNLKKASYAAGLHGNLSIGCMLNQHLGVELGAIAGLAMKKYNFSFTSTQANTPYTDEFTSYARLPLILTPSIVVSTGDKKISAYARVGLAIAIAGKIITGEHYKDTSGEIATIFEVKNYPSLGFTGAAGARYKLNNSLNLWIEANGLLMNLDPKKGAYTSWVQDGYQVLSQVNTSDTHFEYTHSFSNKIGSPNVASKALAFSTPFSNIGISLGLSMRL